jgi:predicted ATPase/nucleoside phosphorylase
MLDRIDVLLVTATPVETEETLAVLGRHVPVHQTRTRALGNRIYYDLGLINGVTVALIQSEMGSGTPGGSLQTLEAAIRSRRPSIIIAVGIAFGLRPDKQHLGDVLVAQQVFNYDLVKVAPANDGRPVLFQRGERPATALLLRDRFRNAVVDWPRRTEIPVHFGLLFSGDTLVNHWSLRDELLALAPEALGGEMEAAGIYAAAHMHKVDWIVVKAISDWADGTKGRNPVEEDRQQRRATRNAAELVLHVLLQRRLAGQSDDVAITTSAGNLPPARNPLVGRAQDLDAVEALLNNPQVRLVTLTGPGGIGKTRLALQAATELQHAFPDGTWLVPLAPLPSADLVLDAIAQVFDVRQGRNQTLTEAVIDYLREKRLLLLLDNFEHLLAAASLVSELLLAAPQLKVLATSRAGLRLAGEHEYAVPPLAVPLIERKEMDATQRQAILQSPAVELFRQRALAVASDWSTHPDGAIRDEHLQAVGEICVRLDGLPLAVELAAARVKLLSPQAILKRLNKRFQLLTGGARDLPTRQQTLRSLIDWSYQLLGPEEQVLFARLAVFAGSFTVEAVEAVCGTVGDMQQDVLDMLSTLIDQSLVQRSDEVRGERRLMVLETLREYGLEQLAQQGELELLQTQHASYYGDLARKAAPKLRGAEQLEWLAQLEAESANLNVALYWCLQDKHDVMHGARLVGDLGYYWWLHNHYQEGQRWAELALAEQAGVHGELRGLALNTASMCALGTGQYEQAVQWTHEAIQIWQELQDVWQESFAQCILGAAFNHQRDFQRAVTTLEEARRLAVVSGDPWLQALALGYLVLNYENSDPSEGVTIGEEGLQLAREVGDRRIYCLLLTLVSNLEGFRGNFERSRLLAEEILTIAQDLGDRRLMAGVRINLSVEAAELGNYERSQELL